MVKKISFVVLEKKIMKKILGKRDSQSIALEKQYLNGG